MAAWMALLRSAARFRLAAVGLARMRSTQRRPSNSKLISMDDSDAGLTPSNPRFMLFPVRHGIAASGDAAAMVHDGRRGRRPVREAPVTLRDRHGIGPGIRPTRAI